MASRLFAGTDAGFVVLREDRDWSVENEVQCGRVESLVTLDEGRMVFGAVGNDGVYASRDGRAWDRVFAADVRAMAADPSDPGSVYAGTEPVRLFKTRDAGDSWEEVEGLQRVPEKVQEKWWFPVYPHEGHVKSVWFDPTDSQIGYLGLEHGGIVRTFDAGRTWEDISDGIEYLDIHMVAGDPLRHNVVYAATARAFYRSEDFGRGWVLSTGGLHRDYMHDFTVTPGEQSTLLMATANGTPPAWIRPSRAEAAIYRSQDWGGSWQQVGSGMPGMLEPMVWAIVADPHRPSTLFAGLGEWRVGDGPAHGEIWRSEDDGATWRQIYRGDQPVKALCLAGA